MSDLHGGGGGHEPDGGDHGLGGIYVAKVTQNKDSDKNLARVKVSYPWLPNEDEQSYWAPICVPMVGSEFGTYFLPEVGDVVLVAFIAGDVRYPVVVGGMWSEEDTPPETNEGEKNDFRLIKSRSGHRLLLDDSSSGKLVLSDKSDDNHLACGQHTSGGSGPNTYGVGSPPALGSDAKKGVALGALSGTLNILCPSGTLTVEAQSIEINADTGVDIKASGDAKIKASGKALFQSAGPGQYGGSSSKAN